MSDLDAFKQQMEALQQAYVKQLPHKIRQIEDLWRAVCGGASDEETLQLLYYLIHKLNGSGPTFGFTAITERAERLGEVVKQVMAHQQGLSPEEKASGDKAMASLKLIAQAGVTRLSGYASLDSQEEDWGDEEIYGIPLTAEDYTVLVADDESFLRKKLVLILRQAGFQVEEAEDGLAALRQARIQRPDIILMDYLMPVMDGVEAIEVLRRDETMRSLPILLLTTHQKIQDVRRAVECDVQGYIAKPFDAVEVIEQVKACLSGVPAGTPSGAATMQPDRPPAPPPAPKKHILIADDYVLYRKKIALTLEQAGYDVEEADNGVMAIKQARERHPDLILMDVMMPVMDGLEATQHIRMDEQLRDVPIIVLTTNIKMKDVPIALASGADAYISKPQSAEVLIEKVKSCLMA